MHVSSRSLLRILVLAALLAVPGVTASEPLAPRDDSRPASDPGTAVHEKFRLELPGLGRTLAIRAEWNGFSAAVAEHDASLIDGFVGVDCFFLGKFGLSIGLKMYSVDALNEVKDHRIDTGSSETYVGFVVNL